MWTYGIPGKLHKSNGGVEVEYYDAVTGEHGKLDEFPPIILFK